MVLADEARRTRLSGSRAALTWPWVACDYAVPVDGAKSAALVAPALYFVMNDATLLSMVEVPSLRQPGATETRVIIRDMTGRCVRTRA